jgi:putative tryptophan/tyrosine transport system substrate-binding protein
LATHAKFTEVFSPESAAIAQAISQSKPALIFAIGQDATKLAQQQGGNVPVISTLVLNDQAFKPANSTGVSLTYSLATQIQWLKKLLPEQSNVGVLFNPEENAGTVQELKKIIDQASLKLKAIPVETPRQLPDALDQLSGSDIQVLLAIPDRIALSPATVKEVMLSSFRSRTPLVGLSENWVKSGALYALTWDYDDLGQQCALQAQRLLSGQAVKSIPPETPRKITYAINAKIAEHMNITIPESLLRKAKTTFN